MAADKSLATRASRGALVAMSGQGVRVLVQVLSVIVLARLLAPGDYGLIAEVLTVVGLGEIFRDFGLSSAAVQAKTLSAAERSNLFWLNTLIGAALTVVTLIAAPGVALLYHEPRLQQLTMVLSIAFLINGVSTQFRADLNRNLMFGKSALAEVAGQVVGLLLGVLMAVLGYGYWALAGQQIAQALVTLVFFAVYARFRPGRYQRGVSMRRFLGFGFDVVAGQLLGYAGKNTDTLMIGTTMGAAALGYYNRAFQLLSMPLAQINAPATRVALAVLSQLQSDAERFRRYLLAGQSVMLHVVLIVFSTTGALASPLILLVLGEQWSPSVPLFQALAFAGVFITAGYSTFWVFLAKGLTRSQLWWQVVSRPPFVAIIVVGSLAGTMGVASAYALATACSWAVGLVWIARTSDAPAGAMFRAAACAMIGYVLPTAFAAASLLLPTANNPWSALAIGIGAWGVGFALTILIWPAFRRDVATVVRVLSTFRSRRGAGTSGGTLTPPEETTAPVSI